MKNFLTIALILGSICSIGCRSDQIIEEEPFNDPIEITEYNYYLRTVKDGVTDKLFVQCRAQKTKEETLIYAKDTINNTQVVIGIKGFEPGNHKGNLWGLGGSSEGGIIDVIEYTILDYDEVGGVITGSFHDSTFSGDFVAERFK